MIYFSLVIFKSKPHLNCLSAEDALCSIARFSCTLSARQCFRAVPCGASWKFSVHVQPVSRHLVHQSHPAPPGNQNWVGILNNSEFIKYSDFLPSNVASTPHNLCELFINSCRIILGLCRRTNAASLIATRDLLWYDKQGSFNLCYVCCDLKYAMKCKKYRQSV